MTRSKARAHCYEYPRPALAVDMVVLTIVDLDLKVLLIERGEPPFRGRWALPGGFVRVTDDEGQGEDLDAAAVRELREETNLRPDDVFLQQLRAFGRPGRDPRGRVVSIAYFALVPADRVPRIHAGDDAADAAWASTTRLAERDLAFDHHEIIEAALAEIRARIDGDLAMAMSLVPAEFTKAELRRVYEVVHGQAYDKSNFNKRFNRMAEDGVIVEAPGKRVLTGPGRPAHLYAFDHSSSKR
jgi:8-oxo-dGTP diphosphatase